MKSQTAEVLGISARTRRPAMQVLDDICRFVRYGDLAQEFDGAAYGLAWAIETARVSGQVEEWFKGLSAYKVCCLVDRAVEAGLVAADAPRFLVRESR